MLSEALKAAAQEAEKLEKRQEDQEARLTTCEDRILALETESRRLKGVLSKAKDSLYEVILSLEELER